MSFTIPDMLARWSRKRPAQLAMTDTETSFTYGELDERTTRLAHALAAAGVTAGDRVGYLGRNSIEYYEVFFALVRIGAVIVPLNWRLTADEVDYLITDSGTRLVVADDEFAHLLPPQVDVIRVGEEYESTIREAAATPLRGLSMPDDIVVQAYTSGTTSMPKGVLLSNRTFEHVMGMRTKFRMNEDTVVLAVMPNFHVGGSVFGIFGLQLGVPLVVIRAFDPVDLPRQIERYRVTHFNIAPTMGTMMADRLKPGGPDLSSLRAVIYGGAPITMKEHRRLGATIGAPFVQMYGMTENSALTCLDHDEHVGDKLGSAGRPVDGVEIEIHDPETGEQVPPGGSGEVWVRCRGNAFGYWQLPAATERLFAGEWMRTGDGGRLDDDGFLFLTDRISDLIITGGENVYPAEVERVLVTHPDVREVAVVGLPDRTWGEAVTAVIVLEPGAHVSGADVIDWSRDKLPGFRRPRAVHQVAELPRNAAGKIVRRELRDHFGAVRRD